MPPSTNVKKRRHSVASRRDQAPKGKARAFRSGKVERMTPSTIWISQRQKGLNAELFGKENEFRS